MILVCVCAHGIFFFAPIIGKQFFFLCWGKGVLLLLLLPDYHAVVIKFCTIVCIELKLFISFWWNDHPPTKCFFSIPTDVVCLSFYHFNWFGKGASLKGNFIAISKFIHQEIERDPWWMKKKKRKEYINRICCKCLGLINSQSY